MTTQTTEQRTPEEIAELKRQWRADGCWDIEDTDGFEAHREELLAYRIEVEAELRAHWAKVEAEDKERERLRLEARVQETGLSVPALQIIERLEARVAALERQRE